MINHCYEPVGANGIVDGITPVQMGEFLDLVENFSGFRPTGAGDQFRLRAWEIARVIEIFTLKDCPLVIAKIAKGVDNRGFYRDIYHFEGETWVYQLRHRPDMAYPALSSLNPDIQPEFQKWAFEGDEKCFVRDVVQAKLMMLV